MRYVRHGAALVDVYLGNPQQRAKNYMDALLAFWPGLQVLKGDLEPAVSTHHMLFHVMKQHKFIPEVKCLFEGVGWCLCVNSCLTLICRHSLWISEFIGPSIL